MKILERTFLATGALAFCAITLSATFFCLSLYQQMKIENAKLELAIQTLSIGEIILESEAAD